MKRRSQVSALAFALLASGGADSGCRTRKVADSDSAPTPQDVGRIGRGSASQDGDALPCLDSVQTIVGKTSKMGSVDEAMHTVLAERDFSRFLDAAIFFGGKDPKALMRLTDSLTSRQEVGLTNLADLYIPSRGELGDLQSQGHGWTIQDDLFIVAGRANWILSTVTCRTFGYVDLGTRTPRLALLRALWRRQLSGEEIALRSGDPRVAVLPLMSRRGISQAVADLALAQVTHDDAVQRLAAELALATGEHTFGADAGAWGKWLDKAWWNLYFDWHRFQMRVSRERRVDEDMALPTRD